MTPGLAGARATLASYQPAVPAQAAVRDEMIAFCDAHPDALLRTCAPGHLTGSAVVLDATGAHVLLMLHRKLGRWLQMGGHCDGDGDLAAVALREATEESGIAGLRLLPEPVDLDIHPVPCPPGHAGRHLDVRYVALAPPGVAAPGNRESIAVRWFPLDRLPTGSDPGTRRMVEAAVARAGASRP